MEGAVPYRENLKASLRSHQNVYVHPEDVSEEHRKTKGFYQFYDLDQYKLNQKAAVEFVKRNPNFRLGLQLHKYYNLD